MTRFPLLTLAWRSLRQKPSRLIMMFCAISIGVGFVVASFVVADSLTETFEGIAVGSTEGIDVQVRAIGDEPLLDVELLSVLRSLDDVVEATPSVEADDNSVVGLDANGEQLLLAGPPIKSFSWSGEANAVLWLGEGSAPLGESEVAISREYAGDLGATLGSPVTLATIGGLREFTLVGIADTEGVAGAEFVLFDLATAQSVYEMQLFDSIDLVAATPSDVDSVLASLEPLLPVGVEAVTRDVVAADFQDPFNTIIGLLGNVLLGFAAIACVVSVFVIYNTFAVVVSQRNKEFGLLRAIGIGNGQLVRSVALEALTLGVVASLLGLAVGIGLAEGIEAMFTAIGGFPETGTIVGVRTVLAAFALGVGVTMLAALGPAILAGRTSPLALLRLDGAETTSTTRALGSYLTFVSRLFARLRRPSVASQMATRSAGSNAKRTGATAGAIMLGVAVIVIVSTVGASLKSTFREALDDSLAANVIVAVESAETRERVEVALVDEFGRGAVVVGVVAAADGGETEVLYLVGPSAAEAEGIVRQYPGATATDRSAFSANATTQIDQLILLANLLLGLTLVVALFGVANTMGLSIAERTSELRLQRIVGMSRRQLRRSVRLEALYICAVGTPVGLLVGGAFAMAAIAVLPNDLVDGVTIPVGSLLTLVAVVSFGTVAAASLPAYRASRVPLLGG